MQEKLLTNYKSITRIIVGAVLYLLFYLYPNVPQIEEYLFQFGLGKIFSSLVKPTIFIILFQIVLYIYDIFIWRLIFTKNDYQGWWLYRNEYHHPRSTPINKGIVYIKQTPLKIAMIDGMSLDLEGTTQHQAFWNSLAMEIARDGFLVSCYRVERMGIDKPVNTSERFLLNSISVEEISRQITDKLTKLPITLRGKFYNCIERDFNGETDTLAKRGEAKFVRITEKERNELIELQSAPQDPNKSNTEHPLDVKINALLNRKSSASNWEALWKRVSSIWE